MDPNLASPSLAPDAGPSSEVARVVRPAPRSGRVGKGVQLQDMDAFAKEIADNYDNDARYVGQVADRTMSGYERAFVLLMTVLDIWLQVMKSKDPQAAANLPANADVVFVRGCDWVFPYPLLIAMARACCKPVLYRDLTDIANDQPLVSRPRMEYSATSDFWDMIKNHDKRRPWVSPLDKGQTTQAAKWIHDNAEELKLQPSRKKNFGRGGVGRAGKAKTLTSRKVDHDNQEDLVSCGNESDPYSPSPRPRGGRQVKRAKVDAGGGVGASEHPMLNRSLNASIPSLLSPTPSLNYSDRERSMDSFVGSEAWPPTPGISFPYFGPSSLSTGQESIPETSSEPLPNATTNQNPFSFNTNNQNPFPFNTNNQNPLPFDPLFLNSNNQNPFPFDPLPSNINNQNPFPFDPLSLNTNNQDPLPSITTRWDQFGQSHLESSLSSQGENAPTSQEGQSEELNPDAIPSPEEILAMNQEQMNAYLESIKGMFG